MLIPEALDTAPLYREKTLGNLYILSYPLSVPAHAHKEKERERRKKKEQEIPAAVVKEAVKAKGVEEEADGSVVVLNQAHKGEG